jgi:hypothetical protein
MAKVEMYASKAAMQKHEKGEGSKMQMFEKKQGIKNVVKKTAPKKAAPKKMGKKK